MTTTVRKAVIPAAGLGTRFLPATKSPPKEMLPVVDKPSIQYVVEEAVRAGLTDILIITGRGKRAIEDHFDRNFELEHYLEQAGKRRPARRRCRRPRSSADIHYIRQRDPLGLGHAVSVAREHVGDEPFAVLLGDDIMVDDAALLRSMLDVHERYGRSVLALLEVAPEEISSYGCVEPELVHEGLVEVQAHRREAAGRRGAVEPRGDRAVRLHAGDLRRARPHRLRAEAASCSSPTRSALLLADQTVYGAVFETGRYDIGQKVDFLRANVELALDRPDLGRRRRGDHRRHRTAPRAAPVIAYEEAPVADPSTPSRRSSRGPSTGSMHSVSCSPTDVDSGEDVPPFANTAMDGYAVRASDTSGADEAVSGATPCGRRAAGRSGTVDRCRARARRSAS